MSVPALPPTTVAFRSRTCVNQSSLLRHFVLAGDRGLGLKFARVASGAAGTGGLEFGVGLESEFFKRRSLRGSWRCAPSTTNLVWCSSSSRAQGCDLSFQTIAQQRIVGEPMNYENEELGVGSG